jgi:hypothetical protein
MTAVDLNATQEKIIRAYYAGWGTKNWDQIDALLSAGFTFTSPNGDDHIDKSAFRAKCWRQADYIAHFELESVVTKGDEAFVKYCCKTKNGHSFRNIEHFRFNRGKVESIEVYFGGPLGSPSAVSAGHQ